MKKIKKVFKKNEKLFEIAKFFYFYFLVFRIYFERVIYSPFLLLPLDSNKVVGSSFIGHSFGDNPGAIIDELYKLKSSSFQLYWIVRDKYKLTEDFPEYIKPLVLGSPSYYYHMSTSKFWIDNSRKDRYPFKRRKQIYLQTWHGGISFKKIEKDAKLKLPRYYLFCAKRDSRNVDYMISNSSFQTNLIKKSFWYTGEILKTGTPRLDDLINCDLNSREIEEIKTKLNIGKSNKVILYAPTFRNNNSSDAYIRDLESIRKIYGDKSKLIVKIHPNMSNEDYPVDFSENIILAQSDVNIYALMYVSDILITDYSSTMFEFAMVKKPVFLLTKDYENYLNERGSYFSPRELPFILNFNESDLLSTMKNFNYAIYLKELEQFFSRIELYEKGTASSQIVNYLFNDN